MNELLPEEPLRLSDEMLMLRAQVRRFVEEKIIPHGEAWEEAGKIPRELYRELGSLGFLGLRFPTEYGGSELGAISSAIFGEELGRSTFGGVAGAVAVQSDCSIIHVSNHGTPEQKERYLAPACRGEKVVSIAVTEANAGSDVAGLNTRAVLDGDEWVINGSKLYISNGYYGDLFIIAARTDTTVKASRGVSLFIVERDTPGLVIARKLEKTGMRSGDTAELYFDNLRVPKSALIGEEGKGFYYIMETFQNERLLSGAICVGHCTKAIELTLDYLKQRKAFGKTLWDQPVIRNKLANLAAKTAAIRALTYQCAQLMEDGKDVVREISMLKALAPEITQEVLYGCVQFHGGTGYMIGTAVERLSRDARILSIGGGATEVMLEEVAKRM